MSRSDGDGTTSPASGRHDIALGPQRRQITVMFCDLVGSTELSTRLDPEDMGEVISAYHRCCADGVGRAGGFVAKYMGDGVLAYFGYPQAHEDDPERAIHAGLEITRAAQELQSPNGDQLAIRIGVATGLVIVGDLIGAGSSKERAVVGDTPNLAARLQAIAEPNRVVVADETRRLAGGMFEYRRLGPLTLKGLAQPVSAWEVAGANTTSGRFAAHHPLNPTPMVGRDSRFS